jgi:hypothetical protein
VRMDIATLKKWREAASIFALVFIPIAVPVTLAVMQYRSAKETVRQQYVSLAIGILREPTAKTTADTVGTDPSTGAKKEPDAVNESKKEADIALRRWAVDMINASAPIKLPDALKEDLTSGQTGLKVVEGIDLWRQSGSGTGENDNQISMYECSPTEPYHPGDRFKCRPSDDGRGIHYK